MAKRIEVKYSKPNMCPLDVDKIYVFMWSDKNEEFQSKSINLTISAYKKSGLELIEASRIVFYNSKKIKVDKSPNGFSISTKYFATQIQRDSAYRQLIKYFDDNLKLVIKLLLAINDLATLREFGKGKAFLKNKYQEFEYLTDSNTSQYAFSRGFVSIFKELLPKRTVNDGIFEVIPFKIPSQTDSHVLNLDFTLDEFLPSRINVLAGQNGSGKSYAIQGIIESECSKLDNGLFQTRQRIANRIIVFSNTIDDKYISNASQAKYIDSNSDYTYVNLIKNSRFDTMYGERKKYTTSWGMHEILHRDATEYANHKKIDIFISVCTKILGENLVILPLLGNYDYEVDVEILKSDRLPQIMSEIDKSKELKFIRNDGTHIELSSGQKSFIRFLVSTLSAIETNSLIIVDEPENFLHPRLEIEFIRILEDILYSTQSIAIIATHSSTMIREIPSKQVTIFQRDNNGTVTRKPLIETYGNSLQKISDHVFDDISSDRIYLHHAQRIAEQFTNAEDAIPLCDKYDTNMFGLVLSIINKNQKKSND